MIDLKDTIERDFKDLSDIEQYVMRCQKSVFDDLFKSQAYQDFQIKTDKLYNFICLKLEDNKDLLDSFVSFANMCTIQCCSSEEYFFKMGIKEGCTGNIEIPKGEIINIEMPQYLNTQLKENTET